jgi:hypothetical protein
MGNYDRGARFALHLAKLRQSARPFWASTADITYGWCFLLPSPFMIVQQ